MVLSLFYARIPRMKTPTSLPKKFNIWYNAGKEKFFALTKGRHVGIVERIERMTKVIEMKGKKYGRLKVVESAESKSGARRWLCRCECGTLTTVFGYALRNGNTKSCGCLKEEYNARRRQATLERKPIRKPRAIRRVEYKGEMLTIVQASKASGIIEETLRRRVSNGITGKALFHPPTYHRKAGKKNDI